MSAKCIEFNRANSHDAKDAYPRRIIDRRRHGRLNCGRNDIVGGLKQEPPDKDGPVRLAERGDEQADRVQRLAARKHDARTERVKERAQKGAKHASEFGNANDEEKLSNADAQLGCKRKTCMRTTLW